MKIFKDHDNMPQDDDERRETIDRDTILSDFKNHRLKDVVPAAIALPIFILFAVFFQTEYIRNPWPENLEMQMKLIFLSMLILMYLTVAFLLAILTHALYDIFTCAKRGVIVTDTLLSVDTAYRIWWRDWWHCLNFSKHGGYFLAPLRILMRSSLFEYYKFSANHRMFSDHFLDRCLPGDEFYLLLVGNRIKRVYHKKIFELIGEE